MSPKKTDHSRNPTRTREAILDAARELLLDAGQSRLSIRAVADRAGLTHGTIYLYFRDKDDLLYQVAETSAHELAARLRRLPRSLDARERLRQTYLSLVDAALDAPEVFHFVYTLRPTRASGDSTIPPLAAILEAPLVDAVAALSPVVGASAADDARALVLTIVGLVEATRSGIASPSDLRRVAERSIRVTMAGLTTNDA